jgi:hypothetical protein
MWGSNYPRLYQVKQYYDPDGLFFVSPGVGADNFEVKNGRVCKVGSSPVPWINSTTAADGYHAGSGLPNTANPWGRATATDNGNFQLDQSDGYNEFPASQEQADREGPKVGTWGQVRDA